MSNASKISVMESRGFLAGKDAIVRWQAAFHASELMYGRSNVSCTRPAKQ